MFETPKSSNGRQTYTSYFIGRPAASWRCFRARRPQLPGRPRADVRPATAVRRPDAVVGGPDELRLPKWSTAARHPGGARHLAAQHRLHRDPVLRDGDGGLRFDSGAQRPAGLVLHVHDDHDVRSCHRRHRNRSSPPFCFIHPSAAPSSHAAAPSPPLAGP